MKEKEALLRKISGAQVAAAEIFRHSQGNPGGKSAAEAIHKYKLLFENYKSEYERKYGEFTPEGPGSLCREIEKYFDNGLICLFGCDKIYSSFIGELNGTVKLVYEGKTKNVYALENGNYLLKFKDDVTGTDGVFDPGANTVGLTIEGMGNSGLRLTKYFFDLLLEKGVKTHYVSADLSENTMEVLPAVPFGKGLEIICRYKAVGSFMKRYGLYAEEGQDLDAFVEFTLKDDERGDPPITRDGLAMLGILNSDEYEDLKAQTKLICGIIRDELAAHGCTLYDIKLEFGRNGGQVLLIDEISGGNMRAYKDGKVVDPQDLTEIITG